MFNRLPKTPNHSFILLGPRGSGKSTWLKNNIKRDFLLIDLLDLKTQRILLKNPEKLSDMIDARQSSIKWIVIDEIQKIPALLDTVHSFIEKTKLKFALSGSSARKLKKGAANLLAGRAFELRMYPLTAIELSQKFNLQLALEWGTLPKIFSFKKKSDRIDYLQAYAHLYIKEEIKEEQIVRKLDPFMDFLSVAAQSDTRIINFSKIAKDVGVDTTTVMSYFKILEDTFIGSYLPAYHTSVRKRQRQNPKFYFFDNGVRRALDGTIDEPIPPGRKEYGRIFECFLMNEFFRMNFYKKRMYDFSYINADEDSEIDLIIEKARKVKFLIEIKSSDRVDLEDVKNLLNYQKDFPDAKCLCLSNDMNRRTESGIHFLPWQKGLAEIFT
jgi:predicted AAA+ superfamily ATPase